jgi:Flp pilus assembly protein TadG
MNKIAQKGAVTVELALVLPFFMMMTFGIIEFSNAMMKFNALNKVTMDAARYLSVYAKQGGSYSLSAIDPTNNQSLLTNAQRLITCGRISACSSYSMLVPSPVLDTATTSVAANGMITVVANYTYPSIFNNIFGTGISLQNFPLVSTVKVQAL